MRPKGVSTKLHRLECLMIWKTKEHVGTRRVWKALRFH